MRFDQNIHLPQGMLNLPYTILFKTSNHHIETYSIQNVHLTDVQLNVRFST